MDSGISAISFSVMPRTNKVGMRVTNVKGERARGQGRVAILAPRESTAAARQSCGLQDRRQARCALVASNDATLRNASTLADFDMNASSYRHMSMAQPDGPTALPYWLT
jgi:hypothetical protein